VFDQVSFRFDEPWILKNISLTINKGETIGIVGGSGSGKSTLIDLILRLNDPEQGVVTCDYIDIKKYRQDMYRKCFGIVTQECLLFNTSLRDNIILGRKPDEDDLQRACKIANIDNFVSKLPKGFDTTVGDRGTILSGGQRQRVAIARAVYAHPDILILDEATSALDTISERKVQKAINEAITGVTAVIVAHRLSTILHADKIVVLKDGRIEAVGSHKQLLETCQVYTDMVQHQLV
jgi:ATP-binding cassette subfamily B protein/subfamily B ATP-binding cassette protein MsbA